MLLVDIKELYFKTGVKNKKHFIPMHAVSLEIGYSISLVYAQPSATPTVHFLG